MIGVIRARRPPISGDPHVFFSEHDGDACGQAFSYTTSRDFGLRFKRVDHVLEIGLLPYLIRWQGEHGYRDVYVESERYNATAGA